MCHNCLQENELESKFDCRNIDLSFLDPIIKKYTGQAGNIIGILQETQDIYGYLPLKALQKIADKTLNKKAKIYGVATFYSQFRLKPTGKYIILQCQGTVCHVNGAKEISIAICKHLGIKPGETTNDGLFTLEDVACLGCCSLAPVIMINGETYGKIKPENVRKIFNEIVEGEKGC